MKKIAVTVKMPRWFVKVRTNVQKHSAGSIFQFFIAELPRKPRFQDKLENYESKKIWL